MPAITTIQRYKGKTFKGVTGATVTTPQVSKKASKIQLSSYKLAYKQAKNLLGGENDKIAQEYLGLFTQAGTPKARQIRTTKQRQKFNELTERIRQIRKKEIEEEKKAKAQKKYEEEILKKLTGENGLEEEEAKDFLSILTNEIDSVFNSLWYELNKTLERGGDDNHSENATRIYDIVTDKLKNKVGFLRQAQSYYNKKDDEYWILEDNLQSIKSDLGVFIDNVDEKMTDEEIDMLIDKVTGYNRANEDELKDIKKKVNKMKKGR